MDFTRGIQVIFALLFAVITISAFALSYVNLADAAVQAGIPSTLAPLWPLCLDIFILMGSLFVLQASINHERTVEGWIVLLSFTVVSTVFNIAHSPSDLMAQAAHGLPPLALCASLELLMIRLKRDLMKSQSTSEDPQSTPEDPQSIAEVPEVTDTTPLPFPPEKLNKVCEWFTVNPDGKVYLATKDLKMGYSTIRDIRDHLVRTGQISLG